MLEYFDGFLKNIEPACLVLMGFLGIIFPFSHGAIYQPLVLIQQTPIQIKQVDT